MSSDKIDAAQLDAMLLAHAKRILPSLLDAVERNREETRRILELHRERP